MSGKVWTIVAGFGLALAVLVLAWVFGGTGDDGAEDQADRPVGPGVSLGDDIRRSDLVGRSMAERIGEVNDGVYVIQEGEGEDARRTFLMWETASQRSGGLVDVTEPRAIVFFGTERAMTVEAREGQFIAPNSKPQRGRFEGDVVASLYERPAPGAELDLDTDQHVRMRVYFEAPARFDLEFNELRSAGPVHVTGPEVDFLGRGLVLTYNRLRNRIEQLDIAEGRLVRFLTQTQDERQAKDEHTPEPVENTDAAPPPTLASMKASSTPAEPASGQADPAEPVEPTDSAESVELAGATEADDAAGPDDELAPLPEGTQFYHATFLRDVRVEVVEEGAEFLGDHLAVVFSLNTQRRAGTDLRVAPEVSAAPDGPWLVPVQNLLDPLDHAEALMDARTLMPQSNRVVRVHWTGPLAMEPYEQTPAFLRSFDDVDLKLQGEPAIAVDRDGQQITARQLGYQRTGNRITAEAWTDRDLVLESPAMGTLTGRSLVFDGLTQSGEITGPGTLRTRGRLDPEASATSPATATAPESTVEDGRALSEDDREALALTWTDALVLSFFPTEDRADSDESPNRRSKNRPLQENPFGPIQAADVRGDVTAEHPRFRFSADRLRLGFALGDDPEVDLRTIHGIGDAAVQSKASEPRRQIDLAGQSLRLTLAPDAQGERAEPRALRALHDVVAKQGDTTLQAPRLDVAFTTKPRESADDTGDASPASAPATATASTPSDFVLVATSPEPSVTEVPATASTSPQPSVDTQPAQPNPSEGSPREEEVDVVVRTLTADGGVTVTRPSRETTITARTLVAEALDDRLTLFGEAETPARITEKYRSIEGELLRFDQVHETAEAEGPGKLVTPTRSDDPDSTLTVAWAERMSVDNPAGIGSFHGEVRLDAVSPTAASSLDAVSLHLEFEPVPLADLDTDEQASDGQARDEPASEDDDDEPRVDTLRSALAIGSDTEPAVFVSRGFELDTPDQDATRTRLEGPKLLFTNREDDQGVDVIGGGRMLLVDHRKPADQPDDDAQTSPGAGQITGRGDTLFRWNQSMRLDAKDNTMTALGDASMVHRPLEDDGQPGDVVRLFARTYRADFEDTGGLATWTGRDAPQPDIVSFTAQRSPEDAVVLESGGRTIAADHLRYVQALERVRLWTDPGRRVTVRQEGQPTPVRVRVLVWDLAKDLLLAEDAGGGLAPLRE